MLSLSTQESQRGYTVLDCACRRRNLRVEANQAVLTDVGCSAPPINLCTRVHGHGEQSKRGRELSSGNSTNSNREERRWTTRRRRRTCPTWTMSRSARRTRDASTHGEIWNPSILRTVWFSDYDYSLHAYARMYYWFWFETACLCRSPMHPASICQSTSSFGFRIGVVVDWLPKLDS
jgi:hypothetical protein